MIDISPELLEEISADSQDVYGKLEIVFADSRHIENATSSVSPTIAGPTDDYEAKFSKDQVYNGFEEETFAWGIANGLDKNGDVITANGRYYCIPSEEQHLEFGWWTNGESDGSGDFATPETLEILFDDRLANSIRFTTAYDLGRVSAARISYKNTSDVWVTHDAVLAADEWEYEWDLAADVTIRGLRIRVDSTHNANDVGRVHELIPQYKYTFDDDTIVSFSVDEVRENTDLTTPVGNTAANTLNVTLSNVDGAFNPDGNGQFSEYMEGDIILFPYVGWDVDGDIEYVALGEFYADDINVSTDVVANINCRDYSKYLQDQSYEYGAFFQNLTGGRAAADTVKIAGVPNRKIWYYENYWEDLKLLNPVSVWRFDDSPNIDDVNDVYEDETITDSHGDHDGTLVYSGVDDIDLGDPSIMPGYSDASIKFDSVVGAHINVPHHADLSFSSEFTMCGLFRLDSTPAALDIILIKGTVADYNYALAVDSSNRLIALAKNAANTTFRGATSQALTLGTAYFFAMWYDATLDKLFIRVDETTNESTTGLVSLYQSTDDLIIGGPNSYEVDGAIQGFALFDRKLSLAEIDKLYIESKISEVYTFPYLYIIDNTFWDGILEWATADLGTFYFNRDGVFTYEYRSTLHETVLERHNVAQYTFSDDTNIVSADRLGQVQSNKVIVMVNPITSINSDVQNIWRAEDGESLVVTKSIEALDAVTTDHLRVQSTNRPLWKNSGLFKVDDEIIGYDSKSGNKLIGLTRGMYGTTPAAHGTYTYSFESNIQKWSPYQGVSLMRSENQAHDGDSSLRVFVDKDVDGVSPRASGPLGKKALMHGVSDVTVSGWIYSETGARSTKIGAIWFDGDGEEISTSYGTLSTSTLSGWKEYTATVTPPSDSKYFTPIFSINAEDKDIFYIDEVECTNVRVKVREARYYDIEYDQAPVINVKYPFITAVIFDDTVTIESFEADQFSAKLLISANESVAAGRTIVLEGTDPTTELDNFFAIAGIPLVEETSSEEVEEISAENPGSIRRHKIKELTIDNKFIQSKSYAQVIVDFLIEHFNNEVPIMNVEVTGVPHLELGDRINVEAIDQLGIEDIDFWILSSSISYEGGLSTSMVLREVS